MAGNGSPVESAATRLASVLIGVGGCLFCLLGRDQPLDGGQRIGVQARRDQLGALPALAFEIGEVFLPGSRCKSSLADQRVP
jgi:hypothetical protein